MAASSQEPGSWTGDIGEELSAETQGDTIAFMFNRAFTREQHDAFVAVFWAFHPSDWFDGGTVVFPSGLEVTLKVVKNP